MRRLTLLLLLALASCTDTVLPRVPHPDGNTYAVADMQELVVLTADDPQLLIDRVTALGYEVRAVYRLGTLGDTMVVLGIPAGRTLAQAIAETEAEVPGITSGANHLYTLQSRPAEGRGGYAAQMIGWPAGGCRARSRVGLLDAGVQPGYPGLADGRIRQESFTGSDAPPRNDHGTRMAELLVGPGRLRGTTLYSANVIDPGLGAGDAAGVVSILRGLDWLAAQDVDVVNISLAGPRNKLLARAMERAADEGMVLIAAVGNAGPAAPPRFPAAFPFALAVTAVDADGAIYRRAVQGDHVDIAAPGVDILLSPGGKLTVSSGTSMAAPFVTAVVAADPALAHRDVADLRAGLAARAEDMGARGPDKVFGAGLLRAPNGC
ncbi:S8 family serine peptidase [Mesobacterium pallidum]|uniref:S8 family serine peptidase n=1 Tax=Mesobacterium pallidum TaxID=2872037 RepID=UPI001EE29A96|nr:S8 family serine peptidase [Mesobacterium pallidum]